MNYLNLEEDGVTKFDGHNIYGYGNVRLVPHYYKHLIEPEAQGKTLLDIGCGDGTLLKIINGNTKTAIGVLPTKAEIIRIGQDIKNIITMIGMEPGKIMVVLPTSKQFIILMLQDGYLAQFKK